MKYFILVLLTSVLLIYCAAPAEDPVTSVGSDGWLSGTTDEKFEEVTEHLGGFSRAMMEVNYRYSELYWAGEDENWEYAFYQLEHIEEAIEDGLKRRPARANSAEHFMNVVIPEMEEAIGSDDKENFDRAFELFTTQCNTCHAMEQVAFIQVVKPEVRTGSVRLR
jgi:mono/diheme cytochrome c family protein